MSSEFAVHKGCLHPPIEELSEGEYKGSDSTCQRKISKHNALRLNSEIYLRHMKAVMKSPCHASSFKLPSEIVADFFRPVD
jgi:hypothetical protein